MIIISGCSWGMGEFGPEPNSKDLICSLTGPGIGQLISLHGKVVNLSEGGSSNTQQLNYLTDFLKKFSPNNDTFYWIVTDPIRCFINSNTLDQLLINQDSLESAIRTTLDNFLLKVNQLAENHNIHINLIGGVCDLDGIAITEYTRLKIVVPSWGKLLDNTYASSIFHFDYMDVVGKLIHGSRIDLLNEWQNISDLTIQKRHSMEKLFKNGLSNDNSHPNRYGHRILRNYLMPEFSCKF